SEHERVDAGIEDGAEAHRAGLASGIEYAVGQRALAQLLRRGPDRQRLRMGSGVEGADFEAARPADHLVTARNERAERLLAHGSAELGLFDRHRHEPFVTAHEWRLSPGVASTQATSPETAAPRKSQVGMIAQPVFALRATVDQDGHCCLSCHAE